MSPNKNRPLVCIYVYARGQDYVAERDSLGKTPTDIMLGQSKRRACGSSKEYSYSSLIYPLLCGARRSSPVSLDLLIYLFGIRLSNY